MALSSDPTRSSLALEAVSHVFSTALRVRVPAVTRPGIMAIFSPLFSPVLTTICDLTRAWLLFQYDKFLLTAWIFLKVTNEFIVFFKVFPKLYSQRHSLKYSPRHSPRHSPRYSTSVIMNSQNLLCSVILVIQT